MSTVAVTCESTAVVGEMGRPRHRYRRIGESQRRLRDFGSSLLLGTISTVQCVGLPYTLAVCHVHVMREPSLLHVVVLN